MRLRTLPVSLAGVLAAAAYANLHNTLHAPVLLLCFLFALLAQISSNFANEYFDYRDGLDAPGREGPRRGVTEGDITPRAMLIATFGVLITACAVGCSLLFFGPWWLLPIGIAIALGVLAYSTGPYPLSRHGLGEVAVVLFFGVVPVTLTYFLQAGSCPMQVWLGSVAFGLMGANVLIINNYRDEPDDRLVHKHTLAVILGPRFMPPLYMLLAIVATLLLIPTFTSLPKAVWVVAAAYLAGAATVVRAMYRLKGRALTPLLGITAISMLVVAIALNLFTL